MEYRFRLAHPHGGEELVPDPSNPHRVRTAFGERSVVQQPGYTAPWWLDADPVPGRRTRLSVAGETHVPVPVTVWAPADSRRAESLPLLVAHDGPEYDDLAGLTRYSAALIGAGRLPRHRVALLHPVDRDGWYSASPAYTRTVAGPVMTALRRRAGVHGEPVVMGASLGGLASLLVALQHPGTFGGVLSQSGSFFQPRKDRQESGYPYFRRITDAVRDLLDGRPAGQPLRIGMTCGALEENAANNRDMAAALRRAGHRVTLAELPDLHSYTAWRDALDPHLTAVLQDCWT